MREDTLPCVPGLRHIAHIPKRRGRSSQERELVAYCYNIHPCVGLNLLCFPSIFNFKHFHEVIFHGWPSLLCPDPLADGHIAHRVWWVRLDLGEREKPWVCGENGKSLQQLGQSASRHGGGLPIEVDHAKPPLTTHSLADPTGWLLMWMSKNIKDQKTK